MGITLIDIPYWWDGTTSSLVATIRKNVPSLFLTQYLDAIPIPEREPATKGITLH